MGLAGHRRRDAAHASDRESPSRREVVVTLTLVVNDDPLLRAGLQMIIESADRLSARVTCGAKAVAEARHCRPDVVLLDIQMRSTDGFRVLKGLLDLPDPPRVAVLSSPTADSSVLAALRIGAAGCLLKDTGPDELVASVRTLAVGNIVLSGLAGSQLLSELNEDAHNSDAAQHARRLTESLSEREHEVLAMVAEGLSNADIGRRLLMGVGTVKDYVSGIFGKLGVVNRVQAAVIADRARLPECAPLERTAG
ncbi:response regulator transcription factor [Streptomyces lunaelactis]|nr:response regulator transcription factor [Streptomyces lunaelactis]NUK10056.1 response regulator transcription factor [Streptomyces lunaelactis]NUK17541.1 response regulator transcription factor [Streptomyces lunaelactis]NUK26587.1 response regulator transcription factor [Streptomyces lunaelactis]NUK52474.1 response regulator transcription factor [Streptomyces lunaelactis]